MVIGLSQEVCSLSDVMMTDSQIQPEVLGSPKIAKKGKRFSKVKKIPEEKISEV
jgi:hypothetical protein